MASHHDDVDGTAMPWRPREVPVDGLPVGIARQIFPYIERLRVGRSPTLFILSQTMFDEPSYPVVGVDQ